MNKAIISFLLGAVVGGSTAYLYTRKMYFDKTKEEVEAVRRYYSEKEASTEDNSEEVSETEESENRVYDSEKINDYHNLVKNNGYTDDISESLPYVITPNEFGDNPDDWDEPTTLMYYANGVLVNAAGAILTNDEIERFVGFDSLDRFGEYEDGVVYIRNERYKTDYEILQDSDNYQ